MSTIVVSRSVRRPAPDIPTGDVAIAAPPVIPPVLGSRWQQAFMIVPMLTGTVATALLFAGREGGTYAYVVGAIFGFSTLGMLVSQWGSGAGLPKKAEMLAARRDYLRHLAALRAQVRDTVARQQAGLHYRHPDPETLWSIVDSFRLWERRPADSDFAVVRVGMGPQTLATPLVAPATGPLDDLEPMCAEALRRFLDTYSVVPDLPVAVSMRSFAHVYVRDEARALVRAIVCQLATFHPPSDVLVAVCASPTRRAEWEWVKWLPHNLHPSAVDALGPVRLVAGDVADLENHLGDVVANRARFDPAGTDSAAPHVFVVLDGGDTAGGQHLLSGLDGVTVLDLDRPPPRRFDRGSLVLRAAGAERQLSTLALDETADDTPPVGRADMLDVASAEAVARRLTPLRLATAGSVDAPLTRELDLAGLLDLGDPAHLDLVRTWAPRPHRQRMRVAIGVSADGQPIELDLKESAQDGMGPHGLLIGATGSGKSELLRTLVIGLAATHSSEVLNFVLIDFKGGATFVSLDRLPHVAAVITNLADELPLVDRMTDAINGELVRRQELLRRAGNFASLREYERARATGAALAPLPSLLIICDEFSELLSAKPDFIDLFLQIGRVGRSLGVHLLLASQRLEEGRLRGLDTHLSYRIGLRTFSALESRAVLGVSDAYELPRSPGHGYLKYGTEAMTRFKAAYVSGAYRPSRRDQIHSGQSIVQDYSTYHVPVPAAVAEEPAAESGTTLLDVLVGGLAGRGAPAHQVWLPPLADSPVLGELLGPVATDSARGLTVAAPHLRGALEIPLAIVDKPYEQRRDVMWLRLSGSAGHVAVVGGPQSGKSTTLRTLVTALALTHTPAEVHVYCLDFGGGQLAALRELPHVGGVAGRLDVPAVHRTVGEIAALLAEREREPSGAGWPHVFLVVDGWTTLRQEYEDLEPVVTDLANRGLSYGVHVVAAASRWMDFRPPIRDVFGSRVELRLGDPSDSTVARKAAANVPERAPGRGITPESLHLLVARPELSTVDASALPARIAEAWTGPAAPPVRMLPDVVAYDAIAADADPANPLALPLGLAEADLRPVRVDFAGEPHLLVFGDTECGKSSLLRCLAATIAGRFDPEQARVIVVDYRRSLLDAVPSTHLIGYGTGVDGTERLVESVAGYMERRLPGPDVTADELRGRSWWSGPECFVLVDDYDLVASGASNPLTPLLDYLAQARDIGLHLVITRRSGGASRALYDPILQRIRELDTPVLVMAGDRDEGALVKNVRPEPMPPGRGRLITRKEGVRLIQLAQPPNG